MKEGNRKEAERLLVDYNALTRAKKTMDDVIGSINK